MTDTPTAPRPPLQPIALAIALLSLGLAHNAQAQAAAAASAPAPAASAPSPTPVTLPPVEVRATRTAETEERRQSTASKIIVGRDEIERYGDSTVGDLLKRLPGVTTAGAPGRGGAIRMRGLGSGYTQILIDGDRVPPGFSIESLSPELIERIEILRAPTAETGARAIAGTINIVMREAVRQRLNQVRATVGVEHGRVQPNIAWTRNDKIDERWTYNLSGTLFRNEPTFQSVTTTTEQDLNTGDPTGVKRNTVDYHDTRQGVNASGRLQWRGERGASALIAPIVVLSRGHGGSTGTSTISSGTVNGATTTPYASTAANGDGGYRLLRLNLQANQPVDAGRIEWRGGLGRSQWNQRLHRSYEGGLATPTPTDEEENNHDNSTNLSAKYTLPVGAEHLVVIGTELEAGRRRELQTRTGDQRFDSHARSSRIAAYGQDEWNLTPQWALHAGLRWEGIVTRAANDTTAPIRNESSVWSPLVHALWKPDPKSRDQVRLSLTRSYKPATLQNLITQPRVSTSPTIGNDPTNPYRAGNPNLRPELATGIDLAVERYLPGSGLLSVNFFHRRISDYMRRGDPVPTTVPWSLTPQYVAQMENVGKAITQGIETEAKFRVSDVWADAPRLDLRLNASLFRSRVQSVPGPNNRLDQQPSHTANVGADYRVPGTPLTLGGNLNLTPGYSTRTTELSSVQQGSKRVGDVYAMWRFPSGIQLRATASNVAPRDSVSGTTYDDTTTNTRTQSETVSSTALNFQLRLELRL